MKDWRPLGTAHRHRDDAVAAIAQKQGEHDDARSMTSFVRWPGILHAIETMVAAYNEGAGRERLVVTETTDPQHPSATIEAAGSTVPALVVTLDGAEIRVDNRATHSDAGGIKRWVDLTRTDNETAAYVLQEWMERL